MCESVNPNLCYKSMQIRVDMWICSIIHELSKVPRKWESWRGLFILSILFNISEIADIMGYNGKSHRWNERSHRRYKLENSPVAVKCSIGEISCFLTRFTQSFFKLQT